MLATVLISIALAVIVGLVIFKLIRDKKQGKSSCGCGCSTCPHSGVCHSYTNEPKER